jgi:general secretion pathway protein I
VKRPGARSGFTLLEVMVALAVLAGALMAVADLSGNALRNFGYAKDLTAATLLARGKMAELEEKYEGSGFTNFDQTENGTFADQGQPGIRWALELKRPDSTMSPEQLLGSFLGTGGDDVGTQEMLAKLIGGAAGGGGKGGPSSGAPGGLLGGVLQTQLTAFSEELKKGVRLATLRISWKDGKSEHAFDVSTYWVVLNPRAPGGAHGTDPDLPPNLPSPSQAARLQGAGTAPGVLPGQVTSPKTQRLLGNVK